MWGELHAVLPATGECEGGCCWGVKTWPHLIGRVDEDGLVVFVFERLDREVAGAMAGVDDHS